MERVHTRLNRPQKSRDAPPSPASAGSAGTSQDSAIREETMATLMLTRRSLLTSGAAMASGLSMPFVHGAYAAGKLSCGFWDHWVPGANEPLARLCRE